MCVRVTRFGGGAHNLQIFGEDFRSPGTSMLCLVQTGLVSSVECVKQTNCTWPTSIAQVHL